MSGGKRSKRKRLSPAPAPAATMAWRVLGRHVDPARVRLVRIQIAWPRLVPSGLLEVTWPSHIRSGPGGDELAIAVTDNGWLHELTYHRDDLLHRIQTGLPDANIAGIRMRLGPIPDRPPPPPPPPDPPVATLTAEPPRTTIDALHAVADPDLRQAIANARLALSRPAAARR